MTFPPTEPPDDKAKYRQFLIDHGFDPNLNREALQREFDAKTEPERQQIENRWRDFLRTV